MGRRLRFDVCTLTHQQCLLPLLVMLRRMRKAVVFLTTRQQQQRGAHHQPFPTIYLSCHRDLHRLNVAKRPTMTLSARIFSKISAPSFASAPVCQASTASAREILSLTAFKKLSQVRYCHR